MKYQVTLLLGALTVTGTLGANPKIANDLLNARPNPAAKVIVQFNLPPGQNQLNLLRGARRGIEFGFESHQRAHQQHFSLEFANQTVNSSLAFNAGYTGSGGLLSTLLGNSTVAIH
jgi:hypothetical protein